MAYSVVEREAMAILECFRRLSDLLRTSRVLVRTDQKALSFIFGPNSSRVKNDKLIRWRLELSEYNFRISYQRGCQNVSADALSRLASLQPSCKTLHETLAHPGVTRLYEYIQRHKVPISLDEAKREFHTVRLIGIPKLLPPKWSCDLQNYALPPPGQWPKRALQRNCVESSSVPATLHKPPTN